MASKRGGNYFIIPVSPHEDLQENASSRPPRQYILIYCRFCFFSLVVRSGYRIYDTSSRLNAFGVSDN